MGAINGFLITAINVNPFITTLGTGFVYGGLAFIATGSAPVTVADTAFQQLGQGSALGLPVLVWVGTGVFLVGGTVLAFTVYGRSLYAVGGNTEAARLAGLPVNLLRLSTYAALGACAGLAGAMIASRIGVGQADIGGNVTLQVIAVVVIGGTSLFGGEGAVWRTAVGLLMIATINNVSDSLGWTSNVQAVITGSVVISAVALDSLASRRRR